jgi:DNA repair protein RecO (recombination protein O)
MQLPHTLRVDAVVLRHTDWGEADRILGLFTREHGKLRAIAKGVRKIHSRKAGHVEPFTRVALLLAHGRDFWILTQAEMMEAYMPLRENLALTAYAAYTVELIDRFTYDEGQNLALYTLLVDTLKRLCEESDPYIVIRYYEIRLLDLIGFRPELFHCVLCREEILPRDQFFAADLGGVLCPHCGPLHKGALPVLMPTLKMLRHYQRSTFHEAQRAPISGGTRREMESLLQYYLTYLLERGINSTAFLREMKAPYNSGGATG